MSRDVLFSVKSLKGIKNEGDTSNKKKINSNKRKIWDYMSFDY